MLWIDVRLYGHCASWQFPGSRGLSDWLFTLPWLEEGGICSVICQPRDSDSVTLVTALRRIAYAANAGQRDLRIIEVESSIQGLSPLTACLGEFDLDIATGKLRVAESLARVLRTEPTLFIVRLIGADCLDWWETLNDFFEIYCKRYSSNPLAIIILSSMPMISVGPRFDFRQGWPVGVDPWSGGLAMRDRWTYYLHCRIAWEAAGSLSVVEDLEHRTQNLTLGDDEALEKQFNEHAKARIKAVELPIDDWTRLITSYGNLSPERRNQWEQSIWAELYWNPPHSLGPRLAPWVSRAALLQQQKAGPSTPKLRNELICEPLSSAFFKICQQGEALVRSIVFQSGMKEPPSNEADNLLARFRSDTNRNYGYPLSHPARPNDAWAFASLGEVMNAATKRLPEPFRNLSVLRNTIAHGHFFGWNHILTGMDLIQILR